MMHVRVKSKVNVEFIFIYKKRSTNIRFVRISLEYRITFQINFNVNTSNFMFVINISQALNIDM